MEKIVYIPLAITLGASYIGTARASLPGGSANLFYVYDEIRSPLIKHGSIATQVSDDDDSFYTLKNTDTESSDRDEPAFSVDANEQYFTLDELIEFTEIILESPVPFPSPLRAIIPNATFVDASPRPDEYHRLTPGERNFLTEGNPDVYPAQIVLKAAEKNKGNISPLFQAILKQISPAAAEDDSYDDIAVQSSDDADVSDRSLSSPTELVINETEFSILKELAKGNSEYSDLAQGILAVTGANDGWIPRSHQEDLIKVLAYHIKSQSDAVSGQNEGVVQLSHKLSQEEIIFLNRVMTIESSLGYGKCARDILFDADKDGSISLLRKLQLNEILFAYAKTNESASHPRTPLAAAAAAAKDDSNDDIVYPSSVQSSDDADADDSDNSDDEAAAAAVTPRKPCRWTRQVIRIRIKNGEKTCYDSIKLAAIAMVAEGWSISVPSATSYIQSACTENPGKAYDSFWRYRNGKGAYHRTTLKEGRPDLFKQIDVETTFRRFKGRTFLDDRETFKKDCLEKLTLGSRAVIWWKCPNPKCNSSYAAKVSDRVRSRGCPKCTKSNKDIPVILIADDDESRKYLENNKKFQTAIETRIVTRTVTEDFKIELHFKSLTELSHMLDFPRQTVSHALHGRHGMLGRGGLKVKLESAESSSSDESDYSSSSESESESEKPAPRPRKRLRRLESSSSDESSSSSESESESEKI